jgi:hypothetical protein
MCASVPPEASVMRTRVGVLPSPCVMLLAVENVEPPGQVTVLVPPRMPRPTPPVSMTSERSASTTRLTAAQSSGWTCSSAMVMCPC